ncbi:neuraminidase-like domain-containing protein [Methylobacter sp. YRD-M1]|uniref:Tc toxin subunit A-related protein n=1 Tax=Methylobacter sp. YRD-M1 TaxID=2911520 RepID=UPI00227C7649|nr:neuraminidase-like domain-containing protein [Methylobacter sp. YRD-M1]WAK02308.1 PA14 domain-containing protein [Methylobacter sp. YRD-M1]
MSSKKQDEIQGVIANNRPDYASLFGSVELCDCQHCRSIYSPAAYLVDLLRFLELPKFPGITPLDVLIGNPDKKGSDGNTLAGRRPDLAHIQLSCENTNTTLPYVDLVNEVLESYIAFKQTLPLQLDTDNKLVNPPIINPNESSAGVTAAELAANPENTSDLAYEELKAAVYPLSLPFNQPITALRLTLEQMGTSRHEVMEIFGKKGDEAADCARDVEALKITEGEFSILTGKLFDNTLPADRPVSDFYGFEVLTPPTDTDWVKGAVPTGAQEHVTGDTWAFAAFAPPPDSRKATHASTVAPGLHQHFFDHAVATDTLKVEKEDLLFTEIFLDPANMPQEIMLQWHDGTQSNKWNDGTWEHRAYWGPSKSLIVWGIEGTASLRYMGPLPTAGSWQRLEVPAYLVGVAGRELSGMAFTLFDGGATWGVAGKRSPSWLESLTHVPTFLAKTGVTYVELIELLRTRYINPSLPQGKALAIFERIPFSLTRLAELAKNNFPESDLQMLEALNRAKMTVDELRDRVTANFKSLQNLIVLDAPDSACDLTLTRLQHLDGTLLDDAELSRLHRFIRLWRKIGWTVQDLDRAIIALQASDITPTFLRQLGLIVQLQAILELSPQQLLSFWGAIPTTGDDALYRKLFLNKAVRDIDPKFEPVDGEYLSAGANLKINDHVPALLAGLRTRVADLTLIREHNKLAKDDAPLNLATATVLYRYVTLARALNIAVKDLIDLQALSGEKPFSTLSDSNDGFEDIDPARMLGFVRLVGRVEQSGFTPASLSYLFSKLDDAPPNLAPNDESIRLLLTTIREGLVRIAAENVPVDDPNGEVTRTKLSLLFEAHRVEEIAGLIAGTHIYSVPLATLPRDLVKETLVKGLGWANAISDLEPTWKDTEEIGKIVTGRQLFTAPLASLPVDLKLPTDGKVTYDNHELKGKGSLTTIEKDALLALSNNDDYQKAVISLYDQPLELIRQILIERLKWTVADPILMATSLGAADDVNAALIAGRFTAFLSKVLPHLRITLSRSFVKQTVADALNLEPATAAALLDDSGTLLRSDAGNKVPAIADFLALSGDGLKSTYFDNKSLTEPALESRVDPAIDFRWVDKHGFSVRWEGTLVADKTQRYQFHLRAGGKVKLTMDGISPGERSILVDQMKEDVAPTEYTKAVDLEAGKHYGLELEYSNDAAEALVELRWSGPASPAEIVPSYRLYSKAPGDVATAAQHTYIRLHKASLLVNGFKLAPPEIAYLADPAVPPAHPDAFNLNKLPVDDAPDQQSLFAAWTRWNDFTALRALARANPSGFLDVFNSSTAATPKTALVRTTGWDENVLLGLTGTQGFNLQDADYKDTATLLKLADAMRLLSLLGAPPTEVFRWASHAPSMKEARDAAQEAKRAHKARYDNEAWLEIARPIADRLRESQRAALVAYLLPRLGYTDSGQLFEHFLIDVEMSPCMQTSRIKQAISSVQLFVQRCRMNLERNKDPKLDVDPKMIDSARWQWMQNYRLWEANLKVFLYPENWIEPELRDDKSPFFRELESELLQTEVTTDTAEIALGNYLEKLDTVSQLQICGMFEETTFSPDEKRESVLHVFGRTFAAPRIFYYRQLVTVNPNYRYWTAWEKVPLDIEADEVLPVSWNQRLYVFWQVASDQAEKDTDGKLTSNTLYMRRLAWTERRHGKWSAKQMTPAEHAVRVWDARTRLSANVFADSLWIDFWTYKDFASEIPTVTNRGPTVAGQGPVGRKHQGTLPRITISSFDAPFDRTKYGSLKFLNSNGLVKPINVGRADAQLSGFMPLVLTESELPTELEFIHSIETDPHIPIFARIPASGEVRFFGPGPQPYTLNDPFFFQQGPRAYLVLPSSYERAVTAEVSPYLAEAKRAFAVEQESVGTLNAHFTNLNTKANPWLSGRASIAATETRAFSKSDPIKKLSGTFSLDTELFKQGAVNPALLVQRYPAEFKFETFFHPFTAEFQRRLNRYGVAGLLNIDTQKVASLPKVTTFKEAYDPNWKTVKQPWPEHDVDFSFTGAYSRYNWEIFFHLPLFLATRLSQNQRFEDAMRWFHFIFDPTASSSADPVPQRYWNVLPFRETHPQRLDDMLKALHAGNQNVIAQWEDLQAHPFEPHRVARLRLIAYQKTVVMKYVDNLIAWADQLFGRDTIETINQATQLYVLAASLLGPRVQQLPPRGRNTSKTYAQLRQGLDDKFNQAIVSFENDLPFSSRTTSGESSTATTGLLGIGRTFYFCIPKNDKLLGYWDTVADRLFKIRHCMNIEGVVRELPLFEPPIDPALLVRASAQGIDLNSVLNDLSAPLPYYRFSTLLGKALEMTAELRSLGAALLAALEKRDAEHLANLRASHETELLSLVKQVKQQQLTEAQTAESALQKSREVTQTRFDFYNNIAQRIAEETNQLNRLADAQGSQHDGQQAERTASNITTSTYDISIGAINSYLGGPTFSATIGRANIISYYQALSREKNYQASIHTYHANLSSMLGGWKRRSDEWNLQKDLALKELAQIDKQITAASIRVDIAQQELDNTTRQIEQSQEIQEFLRNKYTGEDLYNWMVGDISTIFFQCYQITYDLAKKAERCYRFERGLVTSSFIQFGAWDSMRKGLLSGERLYLQLKQMERSYLDGNRREYEITKHYSLVQNDPLELIKLKEQGWCEIEMPEALFDLDFPGHYMRRIKSVSLTIPAVIGPYNGINCTLTLLRDKTRVKSTQTESYTERDGEEDDRFLTSWTRMQAIATSSGQNDSGLFELNFRDERYLPFEGAGVMSQWRIELPRDFRQFDYDTISDVILHIKYTARDGGVPLRDAAIANLKQQLQSEEGKPQTRLFSLRHEFPSEWQRLQKVADASGNHSQAFSLAKHRFPFMFQGRKIIVNSIDLFGIPKDPAKSPPDFEWKVMLYKPKKDEKQAPESVQLKQAAAIGSLLHMFGNVNEGEVQKLGLSGKEADWTISVPENAVLDSLDSLEDILVLCQYSVTMPKKP